MLVMKLALVTCAVYVGVTVVLFACEIALVSAAWRIVI